MGTVAEHMLVITHTLSTYYRHHRQWKMAAPNPDIVRAIFKNVDTEGKGVVEVSQLAAIFKKWDKDEDGLVKRDEFVEEFVAKYVGVPKERAEKVFDKVDSAGKGEVTLDQLEVVFKAMDTAGTGKIEEEDFVTKWCQMMA